MSTLVMGTQPIMEGRKVRPTLRWFYLNVYNCTQVGGPREVVVQRLQRNQCDMWWLDVVQKEFFAIRFCHNCKWPFIICVFLLRLSKDVSIVSFSLSWRILCIATIFMAAFSYKYCIHVLWAPVAPQLLRASYLHVKVNLPQEQAFGRIMNMFVLVYTLPVCSKWFQVPSFTLTDTLPSPSSCSSGSSCLALPSSLVTSS